MKENGYKVKKIINFFICMIVYFYKIKDLMLFCYKKYNPNSLHVMFFYVYINEFRHFRTIRCLSFVVPSSKEGKIVTLI